MAISLIGQAGIAGGNQTSPQVINYTSSTGNSLILSGFLYYGNATVPGITTITDSAGNTWHYATASSQNPPYAVDTTASSGNSVIFVAWCINAAPVTSVTFTMPNSSPWTRVTLSEWSGILALDSSASAIAASGTSASATLSLSSVGDLVVGACENNSGTSITQPTGWTSFASSGANNTAYDLPGVSGSYSPSWTLGASADWGIALAAFKPAGAPGHSGVLLGLFP